MEKKEVSLPNDKKVTIWRLNYGFRTDLQGAVGRVKQGNNVEVNIGQVQIMTLVYGIYESEDLGIKAPNDIELGLSESEIKDRTKSVRRLEIGGDLLYKEINELNKEIEEEVLKK